MPNSYEDTRFNAFDQQWEEGASCIHAGHRLSRYDRRCLRTKKHKACVKCLAKIAEGRCSFDINEIAKQHRDMALDFWAQVDIREPDECWNWLGPQMSDRGPIYRWKRPWSHTNRVPPARAAFWLAWGDIGLGFSVSQECGNRNCCNPLHLRGVGCGHLLMPEAMDKFNVVFSARALRMDAEHHREQHAERLGLLPDRAEGSTGLWLGEGTVDGLE